MNKQEILRYVGDYSQLFGIKAYELVQGKAKGVRAFDVNNGAGLEFTVIADRCLDIGKLSFQSVNCSYLSKTGFVSPVYYYGNDAAFFRNYFAGLLTTCGLRNVGNSSTENGELFGIHGAISNIPGEEVCASTTWEDEGPVMTISGKMREARFFGENLLLNRKIVCPYGKNTISIHDCIENIGFKTEQLMILYHFNMGYPLLDEAAVFMSPSRTVVPRDAEAAKGADNWTEMQPPTPAYAEQVFYHDLRTDAEGNTCAAIVNLTQMLGIAFRFNKKQLFNLCQWKQMGEGEYVLGIEPSNCYVGGRLDPRNKDVMQHLEPGETKNVDIQIEIISGPQEIYALEEELNKYE